MLPSSMMVDTADPVTSPFRMLCSSVREEVFQGWHDGTMAKVPSAKSDDLSFISRTCRAEAGNPLLEVI